MSDLLKRYGGKNVRALTAQSSACVPVIQSIVQICEAFDPHSGPPPPVVLPYQAIWDTGATNTVITQKVVSDLGLKPSGKVTVQGVGASGTPAHHECNTYLVNLLLPNQVGFYGVRVSENSIAGCDVLIGMDVITTGDFAITNHNGKTTFSFRIPACDEIDFCQEIEAFNRLVGGSKPPLPPDEQRKLRNKRKAERRKSH